MRQRGSKFIEGDNVRRGGDDTLYAAIPGVVFFTTKTKTNFDGSRRTVKIVGVSAQ